MRTPDEQRQRAAEIERARQRRAAAAGKCVACNQPHTHISQKTKKLARKCRPCSLKFAEYARRWKAEQASKPAPRPGCAMHRGQPVAASLGYFPDLSSAQIEAMLARGDAERRRKGIR